MTSSLRKNRSDDHASLDLFSTSPTKPEDLPELLLLERQSKTFPCAYSAPYFAYQTEQKTWHITQGNCHHWNCPRCGLGRAKQEYGRMVEGCRTLAKDFPLFFITITCRGKEISYQYAEENYGAWTNRLLDACRARRKREGGEWHYVQVTERQKRKHPHSHFITTYAPHDAQEYLVRRSKKTESGQYKNIVSTHLRSRWFESQIKRAGLGEQYDISCVESAEGASRYVAKYLFKPTIFQDDWPAGWKRIRYSQSFPKAAERETNAFPLITQEDWYRLAQKAFRVFVSNLDDYEEAKNRLHFHDTIVELKTKAIS
jgi:hypothetical protein